MELHPSTIIWQLLNFLLFAGVVGKFLYQPLNKMIAERQQVIDASLEQAAKADRDLAQLQAERQLLLDESHRQADLIIRQAGERAEKMHAEMLANAEEQVRRMTEDARARILREEQTARQALRDDTAELALSVVARILPRTVDLGLHRQLVNEAIHEVANDE